MSTLDEIDMARIDTLLREAARGSCVCVKCYGVFPDGPSCLAHHKTAHPEAFVINFDSQARKFIRLGSEEYEDRMEALKVRYKR